MDLYPLIRVHYDLDNFRPDGLYHDRDPVVNHSVLGEFPIADYVSVRIMGDEITWELDLPDEVEEMTSVKSSTVATTVTKYKEYKLRHEYVAEAFSSAATDVPLSTIFGVIGDAFDNLTPDFITTDQWGIVHVVELATTRSERREGWLKSFEDKSFTYREPLISRSTNLVCTYTPVVVSQKTVTSNMVLPQELVNDLCLRMQIATAIEDKARESGFDITRGEEMKRSDQIANDIRVGISKIGFKLVPRDDENVIQIDQEFIAESLGNPDEKALMKDYVACRKKMLLSEKVQKPSSDSVISDYVDVLSNGDRKVFNKPTCILPYMVLKHSMKSSYQYKSVCLGEAPQYLMDMWDAALSRACDPECKEGWGVDQLLEEAYSEDKQVIDQMEKNRLSRRGKFKVVNLSEVLTSSTVKHLQRDGLYGKSAKDLPENKVRREFQKKPFHWDTDLNDIDENLRSTEGLEMLDRIPIGQNGPMMLIEHGHDLTDNKIFNLDVVKDWMRTKDFHAYDLMSDICTEVCLSLKQNHAGKEMIVKRLKNFDVYLLIKTTNSTSHVFFSIFVPNGSDFICSKDLPFRHLYQASTGYMTEFVSMKRDKMANFLNASSRFLTLAAFWSDFYGISSMKVSEFLKCPEAVFMLNLSMMISLENKSETEESITQSRYMYMEVFLSDKSRCRPDPMKIIPKLTEIPRSRLNLWCIKRLVSSFNLMLVHRPTRVLDTEETHDGEDLHPGDKWKNLVNIFTGGPLSSATSVVNLMYLGYLKDKNQEADGNSEWALVEKILEEECKIRRDKRAEQYGGATTDDLPKGKGFSMNAIKHGCDLMEKRLRNSLGARWRSLLDTEICNALGRHLTHEIATLKAASSIRHNDTDKDAGIDDQTNVRRIKVLEAMAINAHFYGLNPFMNLKAILESVENSSQGVICDLFKKQQHGGTREIYVLTPDSRILQLFIETISRVICSYFEEETLTNPENKLKMLDLHKVRSCQIAKKRGSIFADFCSSSDKTRWNQNFLMTAMSIPLFRMTEEYMHPAIMRVLNMWANKLIKLPPTVVKLLMTRTELASETYSKLYSKYHNTIDADDVDQRLIKKPKSAFMNLTSGMMQGILHYTSSLLHVAFLASSKRLTLMYLRTAHKKDGVRFTMTSVCSSDDSATILTAFSEKQPQEFSRVDLAAFLDCDVALHTLTVFCRLYCMVESVKSTISLYDYIEFNSEFLFKNTIAMPVIKFVAACLTISESESFARRQYEMYNLISALTSSGFPYLNAYFCQIAQGLLHYKTMGSGTNPLFLHYVDRIMEYPDFSHGFFLMDKDVLVGFPGLSFSRWKSVNNNQLLRSGTTMHFTDEADVASDGTLIDSLTVQHGEHKRWYKLLDRVTEGRESPNTSSFRHLRSVHEKEVDRNLVRERMDIINSSPEVLYRHPETIDELMLKLLAKALNPGVSRSLAKGNPVTQAFSSSSYTLFSHCFTRTSTHKVVMRDLRETREKEVRKLSLLSSLRERAEASSKIMEEGNKLVDLETVFPLHHSYLEIDAVCRQFENHVFFDTHEMRQKKVFVTMHPRTERMPVSLLQSVGNKWFDFNLRVSNSVIKRCWNTYTERFRWLRDTPDESLECSPFLRHSDMHGFISAQSATKRTYLHVGPSVQSERFSHQVFQLIRKCSLRRVFIEPSKQPGVGKRKTTMSDLPSQNPLVREKYEAELSLALYIPNHRKREEMAKAVLATIAGSRPKITDWINLPKWEFELGMMALFQEGKITGDELSDALHNKQMGVRITFTHPQKKEVDSDGRVKWVGNGECIVDAEGIRMRLTLQDDRVTLIRCVEVGRLRLRPDLLTDVFSRLSSKAANNTPGIHLGAVDYRFTGTTIVHPSKPGVPVVKDTDDWYVKTSLRNVSVEVRMGSISLVSLSDRNIPVIVFSSKPWACSTKTVQETPLDNFWEAWVKQRPSTAGAAFEFLSQLSKDMDSTKRMVRNRSEPMVGWVNESLQNRLKTKGIGLTTVNIADTVQTSLIEETMDDQDFEDWMNDLAAEDVGLNDIAEDFAADIMSSIETEMEDLYGGDIPEEWRDLQFDSMLNFESKFSPFKTVLSSWAEEEVDFHKSVLSKECQNYYAMHPIWDEFISQMLTTVDHKWFSKVLHGILPSSEKEIAELLMKTMRIKKSSEEPSMLHRFLKERPMTPAEAEEMEEDND